MLKAVNASNGQRTLSLENTEQTTYNTKQVERKKLKISYSVKKKKAN